LPKRGITISLFGERRITISSFGKEEDNNFPLWQRGRQQFPPLAKGE